MYHVPVLLNESIEGLDLAHGATYADVTFGGGGHTRAILQAMPAEAHLYSFDQDEDAAANAQPLADDERFTFVRSNFRFIKNWMRYYGEDGFDGILADLGVSSHHFDEGSRGFSFRFDAPLDMRMNQKARATAADVVNNYSEERLADIFYMYGELRNSRRLAAAIVKARQQGRITTIAQLKDLLEPMLRAAGGKNLTAQAFQALRIEVNHEMDALRDMLNAATETLRPGGRLVVITYHSLEDRMVKNLMKTGNCEGREDKDFFGRSNSPFRLVNTRVITPSPQELEANPRSRSAKLRIAEKI